MRGFRLVEQQLGARMECAQKEGKALDVIAVNVAKDGGEFHRLAVK